MPALSSDRNNGNNSTIMKSNQTKTINDKDYADADEDAAKNNDSNNNNNNNMKKSTANTIFFRYSPSMSCITRKNFETYFSDIGPVKKCSLIRTDKKQQEQKDNENATSTTSTGREAKGYGFCKFTCQQDAIDAVQQFNESKMVLDDDSGVKVKIWVELADATSATSTSTSGANSSTGAVTKNKKKKKKQEQLLLPKGTPTKNDEANTISTDDLAQLQAKKLTSRVIIRNLSFYATEHNIRQIMEEKFGSVVDIHLPLVPTIDDDNENKNANNKDKKRKMKRKQQHRGFAFVTFADQKSAQKAVDACNNEINKDGGGVIIKKRPVAIDFSVSKIKHRRMMEEDQNKDGDDKDMDEEKVKNDGDGDDNDDDDESSDEDDDDSEEETNDESDSSGDEAEDGKSSKVADRSSYTSSLFLRNLPFDTTRHDIFTLFAEFGRIEGIYLVKDKNTGLAKGTAFVKYESNAGCTRALEASSFSNKDEFESGKDIMTSMDNTNSGIFLHGRRILVDKAVDKNTAESLKVQRDEDGKPIDKKIGKDKRNLYLKGEGRVEEGNNESSKNNGQGSVDIDSWENIPESDQMKRGRAHQEKSTKLRSPLFFINPYRLSLRNLAKHVDESQLKALMAEGIKNGLEKGLVTKDDIVAHWRAGGEMTAREIIEKLKASEEKDDDSEIIPPYDESDGYKKYIPSVFIDRDFEVKDGKVSKHTAPSRGFGFAEFTHHAHALACLRELNNNTSYSAEYVAGGKKAITMKKHLTKSRKQKKKKAKFDEGSNDTDENFVGEDGKVRVPRLIVEFTVENKAKARKQAERKAQQLENTLKQKVVAKQKLLEEKGSDQKNKKKKKSRGAQQRAKKRKLKEAGLNTNEDDEDDENVEKKEKTHQKDHSVSKQESLIPEKKSVKPLKRKKVDKDENEFENMVRNYKKAFSHGSNEIDTTKEVVSERAEITKKRWYD